MMVVNLRALSLVVIGIANCDAFLHYYPVLPASQYYGPRIFSPYPMMPSQLKTTKEEEQEEEVTPNPLLDRAIYQGRGHWECNELELLINKAEFITPEITCQLPDSDLTPT